jgi:pimeloyl-ACP methyl ester carboxylesterase
MTSATATRDIFVEANGLRHHLLARGEPGRPVVMMLHGLSAQAHSFDGIAPRLARQFHVYCLDVRGRGESDWGPPDGYHIDNYVQDLESVRAALGIHEMALVGTSMGGLIGMMYAARHPESARKLVLNDIGPEIDPAGLERIRGYIGHSPAAFPDFKAVVRWYKENYGPMLAGASDEAISEFVRWHVRRDDQGIYVWKMDPAVRTFQAPPPSMAPWDAYKAVRCPILIIRGAQSDVLSRSTLEKMLEASPGAKAVEVPGVGHAPLLTEPAAVEALEAFLGA